MIKENEVSEEVMETEVYFRSLMKGCWTYKNEEESVVVSGGRASQQAAYNLTLSSPTTVENLLHQASEIKVDGEVVVEQEMSY
jgi:hypothetical protein